MKKKMTKEERKNWLRRRYIDEWDRVYHMFQCPDKDKVVDAIVETYREKSVAVVSGTPHILVSYGLDFAEIERAYPRVVSQYHPSRLYALCLQAMRRATDRGDTRIRFLELYKMAVYWERKAGVYKTPTPPLLIAATVQTHFVVEGEWVYRRDLYYSETYIAAALKRIDKNGRKIAVQENMIDRIQLSIGVTYDDSQRAAFSLLHHGVSVLTGGPGTGKTTLLRGLLAAWQTIAKTDIVCMAPTGKAAERMRAAIGLEAATIHHTLGIFPYQSGYEYKNEIPERALVVIDEASMVDAVLAEIALKAVAKAKATLLLVGDEDQLESVGPGSVLRDIISSNIYATARLTTIHRQDGGAIVDNAARIRAGVTGMLHDDSYADKMCATDEELLELLLVKFRAQYDPEHPHDTKIYTPIRDAKYPCSTTAINWMLHQIYAPPYHVGDPIVVLKKLPALGVNRGDHGYITAISDEGLTVQAGKKAVVFAGDNPPEIAHTYYPGEPVIVTSNNYDLQVLNGDEGVVVAVSPEGVTVKIGERRIIFPGVASDLELAYAVTVHKAQGSSCKNCYILIPAEPSCMLSRRLLYVALTRAERRAEILYTGEALAEAIGNVFTHRRITGLAEFLGGVGNVGTGDQKTA